MATHNVPAGDAEARLAVLVETLSELATKINSARDALLNMQEGLPAAGFTLIDSLTLMGWMADRGVQLGTGGIANQMHGGIEAWASSPRLQELVGKMTALQTVTDNTATAPAPVVAESKAFEEQTA